MQRLTSIGLVLFFAGAAMAVEPLTVQERLGYPREARLLILHADDLGMAHSVNRASFEALERGWITSASIMVPTPWFPDVVLFARENPEADLGIHLTLNSEWEGYRWRPLSPTEHVPSLLDEEGFLHSLEDPIVEKGVPADIEKELRAQIDAALAAGIAVSHLDSHMAVLFATRKLFDVYRRIGRSYNLPLLVERYGSRGGVASNGLSAPDETLIDRVLSIGPGVPIADWTQAYERLLAPLPPGVYQLIVHLGYSDDELRGATRGHPDWGAAWRQADFDMVSSERFRKFLKEQNFILIGWRELARARSAGHELR